MAISNRRRGYKTGKYRSRFEAVVSLGLRGLPRVTYESTRIPYTVERTYIPDLDLGPFFVEIKGLFTSADRTKHKLIKAQHPELDIRFVFQRASNRLRPGSKVTYANWCDRNGYKWAEGAVPKEWINEAAATSTARK